MKKQKLTAKNDALGKRIRKFRKRKNLKQIDLATATGLTQTHISLLETGQRGVSMATLQKLASVLGVKANELLPF
jgi:transcriptional regulator with XRE-family HTH domain